MRGWANSRAITCKTYNGQSVVDYVICSQNLTTRVLEFEINNCPIEMKSNHMPLLVKLDFASNNPHNKKRFPHAKEINE